MKFNENLEITNLIGKRIGELRQSENLTQKELAHNVGVSVQQIQKYEYGETNISVVRLMSIAHVFDMCILEILRPALQKHYDLKNIYLMFFTDPLDAELTAQIKKLDPNKKQKLLDFLSN